MIESTKRMLTKQLRRKVKTLNLNWFTQYELHSVLVYTKVKVKYFDLLLLTIKVFLILLLTLF